MAADRGGVASARTLPAVAPAVGLPPGRDELLHAGERTRVRRLQPVEGGESVVCKELLGPGSVARARRELELLDRLADVPGIVRTTGRRHPGVVVLRDDRATSLADATAATPFTVTEVISFARDLVATVAGMHGCGVVHRDLTPNNIVLAGGRGTPIVIDFDLATTVAEDRRAFTGRGELVGTLAYLPPEQTGRTARPVDHRADLYAIGAVLYELVSGHPPFAEDDELHLVHDILVRVPVPLADVDPGVPSMLSRIVERLLEKEPDQRYQSAEGLGDDLATLARLLDEAGTDPDAAAVARLRQAAVPLGARDFPHRLSAPSRPVGREGELATLEGALAEAGTGRGRCVLVTGAPGSGRSALVGELRRAVAARGGWYVAGAAEQFRGGGDGPALQAVRALARLLLAEPDGVLAEVRGTLTAALGHHAQVLTAAVPELAAVVGGAAEAPAAAADDAAEAGSWLRTALVDLLRSVAGPHRAVVLVLDDLQWADRLTLDLLDALVCGGGVPGLLVVGSARSDEAGPEHPLGALTARWERFEAPVTALHVENLPPEAVTELLARMLRLAPAPARELADAVRAATGGNPYATVELVNALRRDGVLRLGVDGWTWEEAAIRRHAGRGDVPALLHERLAALPAGTTDLLHVAACLGGRARLETLAVAAAAPPGDVLARLQPALEEGLLVPAEAGPDAAGAAATGAGDAAGDAVAFRHDRVHQAVLADLDGDRDAGGAPGGDRRRALHRAIARRLAGGGAGLAVTAAEQFLAAGGPAPEGDGRDGPEAVAPLYRLAATHAARAGDYAAAERFLAAAGTLWRATVAPDDPTLIEPAIEHHAALYGLGRLAEADEVYAALLRRGPAPLSLARAAGPQISSLSQRNRHEEALAVGLDLLAALGVRRPPPSGAPPGSGHPLAGLVAWAGTLDLDADLARPEITDPGVLAVERLFSRILPTAFFLGDPATITWIVLQSHRLWAEHGPSAGLAATLSCVGLVTMPALGDFRTGYTVGRHVLAVAEARGYEPETSVLRHRYALHVLPWAQSLRQGVDQARRAREGLLRGGDLQMANHTGLTVLAATLDGGASLEAYEAEIDGVLALAARTGHPHTAQAAVPHQRLVRALTGRTRDVRSFEDDGFDEAAHLESLGPNRLAAGTYHVVRAVGAALAGDTAALARHGEQAVALRRFVPGYPGAVGRLVQALALADRIPGTPAADRPALVAELDECLAWLRARARDVPGNAAHLARWVEAERAGALGEPGAVAAFDAAIAASPSDRPWHAGLVARRAADCFAAVGLDWAARQALAAARRRLRLWGATALVAALDAEHPYLPAMDRATEDAGPRVSRRSSAVSSDAIDLVAILRASQALSAPTRLAELQAALVTQLGALTGATDVVVALRDEVTGTWSVPGDADRPAVPLDEAAARGMLPATVLRYTDRLREPLLVDDAVRDDRFAADPYLAGLERCSLLAVPVVRAGELLAVVVLAHRRRAGAFTAGRLDAVQLILGQLAVTLGNARLYASLEERVAARTRELAAANRQLAELSTTDALTGLANRRRFEDALAEHWEHAVREAAPLTLVMIDIDHFKWFNDRYGHPAGDACLRQVGLALGRAARTTDLVCRYGGEEFVVLVPGAPAAAARAVGERQRAAVEALALVHEPSDVGIVTLSVGVATAVPGPGCADPATLLARADAALYRAKEGGRNRVCSAPEG